MHRIATALLLALGLTLSSAGAEDGLVVTANHSGGGFDMRNDWSTRIDGSEVTVERTGKRNRRPRRLSSQELNALRHSIDTNKFFELQQRYGCSECSDNPVYTLTVTSGGTAKKVQVFCSPDGRLPHAGADAIDVQHFMALWQTIKHLAALGNVPDACS